MLRSVFILATHRYASQKHDNYLDPRQYYSLGYCYMLWFNSCNWYASQIHDNCLSYIFLLLIVVRIIWKSGNNYIDDHTKYEAKSARDGAWYGDSCTWPSYILLFDWLPNITRFSVFKKVTGDVVVYIHVFLIAHLISGRTTHT